MQSLPRGLMLPFLALGLISCSAARPTLPPAPPTVVEVPVYRYRPLPAECLRAWEPPEPETLATNEDVARAYRDLLEAARIRSATLDECRRFNSGEPGGPP